MDSAAPPFDPTSEAHSNVTALIMETDTHERLKLLTYAVHAIKIGGLDSTTRVHSELVKTVLYLVEAMIDHVTNSEDYLQTITNGKVVVVISLAAFMAQYRYDLEWSDPFPEEVKMQDHIGEQEMWRMIRVTSDKAARLVELMFERHPPEVAFMHCENLAWRNVDSKTDRAGLVLDLPNGQ